MSEHRAAQHIKPKNEQASIGSPVRLHNNRSGVFRRTRLRITGLELRVRDFLIEPALHVFLSTRRKPRN
ncbi:hypothetical protein [Hydrocarboniphaga effusa]|uniref:hypothetical protein n=1 Tax=Hydrocarboniphaga effusa TaxID=243629 RepID=UPI003138444B